MNTRIYNPHVSGSRIQYSQDRSHLYGFQQYPDRNKEFNEFPTAFNTPFNRQVNSEMKFSDENPFVREVNDYKSIIRKKKLWVSDKQKKSSTELPEDFSVVLQSEFKHIRYIKPIQVQAVYVTTATPIYNAFVHFPDLDHAETTSNGCKYHGYFPVVQGSGVGVTVPFNFIFSADYITENIQLDRVKDKFRVEVFKEDSSGNIVPFEELTSFVIELEFDFVDHAYKHEKQIRQN